MESFLVFLVLSVILTIADSSRDKRSIRVGGWLEWHIYKWIAFFLPFIVFNYFFFIQDQKIDFMLIIKVLTINSVVGLICLLIWEQIYNSRS